MQVVLLKKVKSLGDPGEVVEVKRGHAINFLIPEELALPATEGFIKEAKSRTRKLLKSVKVDTEKIGEFIKDIDGLELLFKAKVSEKGSLFGSIKKEDIASEISSQKGKAIDEDYIVLDEPIKKVGEYELNIVSGSNKGKIKVKVEAEK